MRECEEAGLHNQEAMAPMNFDELQALQAENLAKAKQILDLCQTTTSPSREFLAEQWKNQKAVESSFLLTEVKIQESASRYPAYLELQYHAKFKVIMQGIELYLQQEKNKMKSGPLKGPTNISESEFKALMSSTKVEGAPSTSQLPTAMAAKGPGTVTTATSTASMATGTTPKPIENPYVASAPIYEETIYEEHGDVTVRPAGERVFNCMIIKL